MAILLALSTAVAWGFAEVLMLGAAKRHGPVVLGLWLMLIGGALTLPLAVGSSALPSAGEWVVPVAAAAVGMVGSVLYWVALRRGSLSVVSPTVATSGGIGAVIAVIALGERLPAAAALGVILATVGVVLASFSRIGERTGAAWAAPAAIALGGYTVLLAVAAERVGVYWALLGYRVVGGIVLAVAAVVRRIDIRLTTGQAAILAVAAVLDTIGFISFTIGLEQGPVAVVAVVSAQFSTIAVILAATLLHERLQHHQWVGVGTMLVATTILGLVS
ncbi:MAG: EamA family transporter [Ilumatobacteraceae bacterium]